MLERQVVVIGLEALSPLAIPCYGNRCQQTPELDRLAARGLIFHEHYARTPNPEITCLDWLGREIHPVELSPFENTAGQESDSSAGAVDVPFPDHVTPSLEQARRDWEAAGVTTRFHFVSVHEPPVEEWIPSTGTRLVWLFVRRESADDNAVLAWLEQMLAHLRGMSERIPATAVTENATENTTTAAGAHSPAGTPLERWIVVTAARGMLPEIERTESTGVEQVLSKSLGPVLWSPLIIGGVTGTPEFGQRELRLTSAADGGRILRNWLTTEQQTESPATLSNVSYTGIQNTLAASRPGVLQWDRDRIAWRTEEDLLLVPRASLLTAEAEPPSEARLFRKPEDRFEMNDLATTVPELLHTRWQALRDAYAR